MKEENGLRKEMRRTNYKFNSADDFVDYKVSYFCQESFEQINRVFNEFIEELGKVLDEDRVLHEKKGHSVE